MILSVSRRTDIPAFYTEWFFNRLKEGYVLVRNPMNYNQVSRISLSPSVIDCIVFWTKNPTNMLDKLGMLKDYKYYFQITINGYDSSIERNLGSKELIIDSFKDLSRKIGKEKTIWRYDPIIMTDEMDIEYHCRQFDLLASQLEGYTERCIISFLDLYKKCERNMKGLGIIHLEDDKMVETGNRLSNIADRYGLEIQTCSESVDLSSVGINHGKCIDDNLISKIAGQNITVKKDENQRELCGCITSIDIGAYNTCKHGCLYCYANYSDKAVKNNILSHNPSSSFLIGEEEPGDQVYERKMESYINRQLSFL